MAVTHWLLLEVKVPVREDEMVGERDRLKLIVAQGVEERLRHMVGVQVLKKEGVIV